jgi:hypothetical protein
MRGAQRPSNSARLCEPPQTTARSGAVETLTAALKHKAPRVRSRALAMLMRLGAKALSALPAVQAALADEDARVRAHAEEASRSMETWRSKGSGA